jgi:hypothetical protein
VRRLPIVILALGVGVPVVTHAQEPVVEEPYEQDETKEAKKEAKEEKKEKKKNGTPDRLEFGGRVYVRDTLLGVDIADETTWLHDRTLDNARVFVSFRPNKRTRMDIEVDFAGDQAELKDTFIRYGLTPSVDLTAGRFKRPVSFIGLESTWDLPRIDRGLLSELRVDDLRLLWAGGRGDGVALGIELPGAIKPELTFTVQESELASDLGLEVTEGTQDVLGRAEIEPREGLHLAVAGGWMGSLRFPGDPESYRHRPFGTLEGYLETAPFRVWLEGMFGLNANTFVDGEQVGRFYAAQTLIAPRFEDVRPFRTIEPYAALSWYEPSHLESDDQLTELDGGVALWLTGKLRLQLEAGRRFAQGDASPSADATIVRVQLGAAFRSETEIR